MDNDIDLRIFLDDCQPDHSGALGRAGMINRQNYPRLQPIITALATAPFEIRLVGGAVRDALLNREFDDFDFAAACDYSTLEAFLKTTTCKIVHRHHQHGNFLCTLDDHTFDITILRRDEFTDGRHANIAETDSWYIDAARRDFSVNALSYDFGGNLHDPLETGLTDLRNQHLRFIGDVRKRLEEDYLRILRFFRFQSQLGFHIEPNDLDVIAEYSSTLQHLSRERIRQEMVKILAKPCSEILMQMQKTGILQQVFTQHQPKISNLQKIKHPNPDWSLRLAMIFLKQRNATDQLSHDLVLSKKESLMLKQRLCPPELSMHPKTWLYRYGRDLSIDYYWLYGVDKIAPAIMTHLEDDPIPTFPLTGRDMQNHGFTGVEIGKALQRSEETWLASDCRLKKHELLAIYTQKTS